MPESTRRATVSRVIGVWTFGWVAVKPAIQGGRAIARLRPTSLGKLITGA